MIVGHRGNRGGKTLVIKPGERFPWENFDGAICLSCGSPIAHDLTEGDRTVRECSHCGTRESYPTNLYPHPDVAAKERRDAHNHQRHDRIARMAGSIAAGLVDRYDLPNEALMPAVGLAMAIDQEVLMRIVIERDGE